jgi:hypothetical protein
MRFVVVVTQQVDHPQLKAESASISPELHKVIVDTNTQTVTARGEALWADFNKAAEEHKLAVVGGR